MNRAEQSIREGWQTQVQLRRRRPSCSQAKLGTSSDSPSCRHYLTAAPRTITKHSTDFYLPFSFYFSFLKCFRSKEMRT